MTSALGRQCTPGVSAAPEIRRTSSAVANVAIVCSSCGKPTRIGYRFEPDGTKVRICRKCEGDLS